MVTIRLSASELTERSGKLLKSVKSRLLRSPEGLSLDMRDVGFASNKAIQQLYELQQLAAEDGKRFQIFGVSAQLHECLDECPQFPLNEIGKQPSVLPKTKRDEKKNSRFNFSFILKGAAAACAVYGLIYVFAVYVFPPDIANQEQAVAKLGQESVANLVVQGNVAVSGSEPVLVLVFSKGEKFASGRLIAQATARNGGFSITIPTEVRNSDYAIYAINLNRNQETGSFETDIREFEKWQTAKTISVRFQF